MSLFVSCFMVVSEEWKRVSLTFQLVGIVKQVQPLFSVLLASALELVTTCPCLGAAGCPNCVQNLSCHEYNEVLDKNAAIMILQVVIEAEDSYFQRWPDSSKRPNTEHQQTL
ncbi:uncharacterized protein LOC122663756 [Telopea speciosissima]|uniref:uncharacterized protein LOC122663756 n=1 Tax=Telopea speciosissima TaxID=54955 RepID=UPI001CC3874C|nr:uncharacterized protein LOC122663756 [Telopea speciosissima]